MKELKLKIEGMEFNVPVFEKDGKNWVALKPLCEALGVDRWTQQKRVCKSEQISWQHMPLTGPDGKTYEMLCVQVEHAGEWIFGINPNKVKPEIREKLIAFRQKLQVVLYNAITGLIDVDMVQQLTNQVKDLTELVQMLFIKIHELEQKNVKFDRFVTAEKSAAGSRLAHQRWANNIN